MRIILFLFSVLILMASCRSTRKITSVVSKKDSTVLVVRPEDSDSAKHVKATFESINSRQIRFNTFSSKVKIDYSDDKDIRIDVNAGHGAGKPTSKQIDEWSDIWSFVMFNLGMKL